MKKTIALFFMLLFAISGITAQSEQLRLTLAPKTDRMGFRDIKYFEFCVKNVSNEGIYVFVPYQKEVHWGGCKTLWFISYEGKVDPPVTNSPPPGVRNMDNKGLVLLKPGDSIMVNNGNIKTTQLGVYKVWGVFVQTPETIIEDYRKKLGNKVNNLHAFELHSDTLTYSYAPFCNPLEKEPDYNDLTVVRKINSSITSYDYPSNSFTDFIYNMSIMDFTHFVQLEITPKDNIEEVAANIHYLKNLRGLKLTLEPGQAIPNFVKELKGLISLTIIINDNLQKKVPLEGLDELASLSSLQYLELGRTFIERCPEWIKKSPSLRALKFLNGFVEHPHLSGIPNLEMLYINLGFGKNLQDILDIANTSTLKNLTFNNYDYELPKNFLTKLKNLKKLTVDAKKIEFVPELTGLNLEELNITIEDSKLTNHYPIGLGTLTQLKRLQMIGCFNNIDFPDMSACNNIEFVDITDRSMTQAPSELKALQARVVDFKLRAPELNK